MSWDSLATLESIGNSGIPHLGNCPGEMLSAVSWMPSV